ncbi:MAG: hypothetical protein E7160_01345 [Firmicutes bacterium]|nr:hypothetical protein [Bacillota bacterium]
MRDAFGGIVNISMIVVFLVIVSGYLAFNVSYTKAFRVKNKIITTIEQYEGLCDEDSDCAKIIDEYIRNIGYSPYTNITVKPNGCTPVHTPNDNGNGYYIARCGGTDDIDNKKVYYKVITFIDINIPIINQVMSGMHIFEVSGNTKLIRER